MAGSRVRKMKTTIIPTIPDNLFIEFSITTLSIQKKHIHYFGNFLPPASLFLTSIQYEFPVPALLLFSLLQSHLVQSMFHNHHLEDVFHQ